ncbi:phosphotransferase family protein [Bacillus salacetis]|uniref:phosphotransferase family protein n=1 Tax=Bacillus salacetis TaxID=2315464 RepID=UPI003B9F2767
MTHLEERLAERGLKLLKKEAINGSHAGRIYRIEAVDEENQKANLVYKEYETDRNNELHLYLKYSDLIKQFNKVVTVWDSRPKAILMHDLNSPLKKDFELRSGSDKRNLIERILDRLAVLHSLSVGKNANGLPTHETTSDWHEWCVDQMNRLCEQNHWTKTEWIKTINNAYEQLDLKNFQQQCPRVITHGDPHLENIFLKDGQIWLIDWEWAALSSPLRDITILCQDLYDTRLIQFVKESYQKVLHNNDFHIPSEEYQRDFNYFYIDHTTMMLAWEIEKYLQEYTSEEKIKEIIEFKIREINRVTNELGVS